MTNKKVWFITGAGRGMGADFAKAALAAGHAVVATGRNTDTVSNALGQSNDLLAVMLDVTKHADAEAAARAAVDRFGRTAIRRPGEACSCADHHRQSGAAAAAFHRWR